MSVHNVGPRPEVIGENRTTVSTAEDDDDDGVPNNGESVRNARAQPLETSNVSRGHY